ncbi:MAG: hypothetical protein VX278_14815, partial [Myxococcota bacterium]|nr:hypothetical protein [Myxococcota bacterium]
ITQHFPDLDTLHAPQNIIEEPPFVLIAPWKIASVADLQTKPLVIKTPSNAYRIPFFRDFFQQQTLKILHLKRRAEHAINGLMDGWAYPRGFHAHWIDTVAIDHPAIPPKLWKYDLPPNWSRVQTAPLHEVCAFQWCQAHHYTLRDRHYADAYHSIWFEDLLDNSSQAIQSLWEWLHVSDESIRPISDLPLVMATCPPRSQRWFAKKEIITQRCAQKDIQYYMEQLREA